MRQYVIHPATHPLPALSGRVFAPEGEPFCEGPCAAIDHYAWGGDYCPEARAYLAWDDVGLRVLLCAREQTISARVAAFGGPVWQDSCLEFFFQPFTDDPRYVNVEVNAAGAALIGIGPDRANRAALTACPKGMDIGASRHDGGWWAVGYTIPFAWVEQVFGRAMARNTAFRGNFYCCDESIHPHFGSWCPIDAPQPDFHRPECFGRLVMEGDTDGVF